MRGRTWPSNEHMDDEADLVDFVLSAIAIVALYAFVIQMMGEAVAAL